MFYIHTEDLTQRFQNYNGKFQLNQFFHYFYVDIAYLFCTNIGNILSFFALDCFLLFIF